MPLARGPQTHDKTQRTFGHAGLVGMRHDGRIEQRRGFRGVFVREVSADERLPFGRSLPRLVQVMSYLREAVAEKLFHTLVPILKLAQHPAQQSGDFLVQEGHDAGDDPPRDVVAAGIKGSHEHARPVGNQGGSNAFGVDGGGFQNKSRLRRGRVGQKDGFCIRYILACMDRKASIDSVSAANCTNSHQFDF